MAGPPSTNEVGSRRCSSTPTAPVVSAGRQPDDYAADLRLDVPAGLIGGDRGRAASTARRRGRAHPRGVPAGPARESTSRSRWAGSRGGRQETGGLRLRALGLAAHARRGRARSCGGRRDPLLLQAQFGPCPYPDLNLAAHRGRRPRAGTAPRGWCCCSGGPPLLRSALRDDPASFPDVPDFFLAHELAHQWWGHGVAGQNYRERWISEGVRPVRGRALGAPEPGRGGVPGRAGRGSPAGPSATTTRARSTSAIGSGTSGRSPGLRAVVYDKGAYVLHMLRRIVGDEAFFAGLGASRRATASARRAPRTSGRRSRPPPALDLGPYFQEWVYGTGIPRLSYRWSRQEVGGEHRVDVRVEAAGLPGTVPLQITVLHAGGAVTRAITVGPGGAQIVVEAPSRPRQVEVNVDRGLLAVVSGASASCAASRCCGPRRRDGRGRPGPWPGPPARRPASSSPCCGGRYRGHPRRRSGPSGCCSR